MNCSDTQPLLVAWQDGELSPGTSARIAEHIAVCGTCREIEMRLRRATPMAGPGLPTDLRRMAWEQIDRAMEAARELTPTGANARAVDAPASLRAWEHVPMPMGAVVGYALVLVLSLVWGLSNWYTAAELKAEQSRRIMVVAPASDVPAEQFRPASYAPGVPEKAPDAP